MSFIRRAAGEAWSRSVSESFPARAEYRPTLTAALETALAFLHGLPTRPAGVVDSGEVPAPPEGIGAEAALEHFRMHYEPRLSGSAGPRYFGFVTGGATPAALAGDWLASAYDQNVSNTIGSVAAALEQATTAAYARLFGLGEEFAGYFVSGATQSNTVALATARQRLYAQRGHDVAEQGLAGAPQLRVLGGAPHSSILKAAAILGIGRRHVEVLRCLPGRTAVDPDALAERLADGGERPTLVVASAGEVNTGDFDDIAALAALCRRHGAWLHVDGAFGLFAALDPAQAGRLAGLALADSVTVDLHKWLNVPYDSALVYTRHPSLQRQVFRASAAYLGDTPDPLHYTPENSRRFRALPAWFALAAYGRKGIGEVVRRNCALARRLGEGLAALPGVELLDEVRLNIVCFALREGDAAKRDRVLDHLLADGRAFMTPTVYAGRPAVRAAISNWSTTEADIDLTLQAVRAALAAA